MRRSPRRLAAPLAAITVAVTAACSPAAPPAASTASTAPPTASPSNAPAAAPDFVNRVWRVAESTAVAPGQLYVFLSDGTLVMTASTGTPSLGRWERSGEGLAMIEEGQRYATDIVALTADEFRIRSHNPGTPVDIRLVPADRAGGSR